MTQNDHANTEVSRELAKQAQSEAPSVDALDKIFEEYQLGNATLKYQAGIDQAKAKINRLIVEAKLDELNKFTHSENSLWVLAEKASYKPHGHDMVHSWPIIDGKVIILQQSYLKYRIKELTEQLGER